MSAATSSHTALLTAYEVAGKANVVVLVQKLGPQGWLIDFEDEDNTLVLVGPDGGALLGVGVPAAELAQHFDAGHRTGREGLGVADGCTMCEGNSTGSFTRPGYVPPTVPETSEAPDEDAA